MDVFKLDDMIGGWFVGDFSPAAHSTGAVEVAVKRYKAGATEAPHYHRVAAEITLILEGVAEMGGQRRTAGDIVKLAPGEVTGFAAITDVCTVVVKLPSVKGDKHPA